MRPHEKSAEKILREALNLYGKPSAEQMESARQLAVGRLESEPADQAGRESTSSEVIRFPRPTKWVAIAVAAAVAVVVLIPLVWSSRAPAVLSIGNATQRIQYGEIVRSHDETAAVVALVDGSRVEMRSQSELLLERADDGVRIRLNKGVILVNAAPQRTGHLYVQTKDVMVSVVGTVFVVNAQEEGSRVAVIEGEVRVQQGVTAKKLLPGQQVSTNPQMEFIPVKEEIAWSPLAEAHLALLEQATAASPPREVFEVISIRPAAPGGGGAGTRGGGRGGGPVGPTPCGGFLQLNTGRIVITNATLFRLVVTAHGKDCRAANEIDLITGLPEWAKSLAFDIQATLPAGAPSYTTQQLNLGEAPRLQAMLQNMLADRFNLTLHRTSKEVPIYELVLVRAGRVKLSEDQTPPPPPPPPPPPGPRDITTPLQLSRGGMALLVDPPGGKVTLAASAIPISQLISIFQGQEGRLVIDKTGLKGLIDIPQVTLDIGPFEVSPGAVSVWPEIMQQIGLKLEPTRGPAEVLVIDRAEKPTEN